MKKNISDRISPETAARLTLLWRLLTACVAVTTIGAIVVDYGFVLDSKEMSVILDIYQGAWYFYFSTFCIKLFFQWKRITRRTVALTATLGLLLFLSSLPKFFAFAGSVQWISDLWTLLSGKYFMIAILGLFSVLEVSKSVVNFINKKTNPALLMATCFAVIIFFGALLLLLPRSTLENVRLPLADAIFISTSAVCVTGLSTVDIARTFSLEGQIVIALLIQTGGLGVMTITSFFAVSFMGGTGLFNQIALRDMVGSDTFRSLISTLLYILGFTFVIETAGAVLIWLSIHSTMDMTLPQEIFFSVFHSVSAFCNAGFSILSGNLGNPLLLDGTHNGFYIIITVLIVSGGIGFPILMNLKETLAYYLRAAADKLSGKKNLRGRYIHIANVNTKIVIVTTAVLIAAGTASIAAVEWNGALAGMSWQAKIVHSLFNSVSPRTAGFNSVDLTMMSFLTIIVYTVLMWIGGASQSTAGGIKVNTLAVSVANLISIVKGRSNVVLFKREISHGSVRRASAVVFGSVVTILVFFVALVVMEPGLEPEALLFETVSAFSTVGSSLNVTPLLSDSSKVTVSVLMFIGRVGLVTVLMSLIPHTEEPKYRLPEGDVIIN